jgi:ParB family chromosome partitioning protein
VDVELTPDERLEIWCVEDLSREDLGPVEQAQAFRALLEVDGRSGSRLSKDLGTSRPSVVASPKLLERSAPVQDLVEGGGLPATSASAIGPLDSPDAR